MSARLLLALLLLAGCSEDAAHARRQARLQGLVGLSETALIRTLGVPTRVLETDGHRFLAYDERRLDILPGAPGPFVAGWQPGGYGGGFPPRVVERGCETTFELVGGTVAAFTERGNSC